MNIIYKVFLLFVLVSGLAGCTSVSVYQWSIGFNVFNQAVHPPIFFLLQFILALNALIGCFVIWHCWVEAEQVKKNKILWSIFGFIFGIVVLFVITARETTKFDPNEVDFWRRLRIVFACYAMHIACIIVVAIILVLSGITDYLGKWLTVYFCTGWIITSPFFWKFFKKHLK